MSKAKFRMGHLDHVHIRVPNREAAMRWYADERNYEGPNQRCERDDDEDRGGGFRLDVSCDHGNKARRALDGGDS